MEFYHNTRCSTSRKALALLSENGIEPEIILYLKEKLSQAKLKVILKKLGIKAEALVRKKEAIYKENYKDSKFTNAQWIKILSEEPKLIERPIFINGDKGVIGRPPDNVLTII